MDADFRESLLRTTFMYVALDEHGHMHSFTRTVGHDLIDRGILWRDNAGHWRVRAKDAVAVLERDPDIAVCDFCAERPVIYECDVDDFKDRHHGHSVGGWAACQACGELVEQRNVEELFERAANRQAERLSVRDMRQPVRDQVLLALVEFHELFWRHFHSIRRV